MDKYGVVTSIRIPLDKIQVRDDFKRLVTEEQHSDICYVTTMLWEAYLKACKQVPEPTIIKLVKQDITINQNCTNIYGTSLKRPRRLMSQENLSSEALPKCDYCKNPATLKFTYPYRGFLNTCQQHKNQIPKGYLTEQQIAKPQIPIEITPSFPLQPKPRKPKKHFSIKKLLSSVLQKLTKRG